MQLTEQEKNRLKLFVTSPDYDIAQKIADSLITQIKSESTVKDTEWETVKGTLTNEGQVTGIQRFIKEIFSSVS